VVRFVTGNYEDYASWRLANDGVAEIKPIKYAPLASA
jgi:hypothetical protein